jgi:hypothetical protein
MSGKHTLSARQSAALSSFHYHKPTDEQIQRIANVRSALKQAAEIVILNTPESADQTAALRKLHEAMMTANKAIVCETPENALPVGS